MPRSQQARYSFSAGVLSRRISLRGDSERHSSACEEAINFIISPQGGAVYRQGMQLIGTPNTDATFRLFQFHRGGNESDVLIEITGSPDAGVTAGKLRFWIDDVLVESAPSTPLAIDNGYLEEELSGLYFTNQETFGIICHKDHPPLYITVDVSGTITAAELSFDKIPLTTYFDSKSPSVVPADSVYNITFPTGGADWTDGDRYTIQYGGTRPFTTEDGEPQFLDYSWSTGVISVNNFNISELLRNNRFLNNNSSTVTQGADPISVEGPYEMTVTGLNAGFTLVVEPLSGQSNAVDVVRTGTTASLTEPAWSFPFVVLHTDTHYYQCIKPNMSDGTNEPDFTDGGGAWEEFWTDLGTTAPDWFAYQHTGDPVWTLSTVYSPWDRGFPTVCVFHEQRLILAAPPEKTTTLWGSAIGDYQEFTLGPDADSPFEFALDTSDTPTVKWMQSQLNLMVGTSGGDWNITAEQSLGPADISAVKQNNARSFKTKPAVVDTEIFYIEQGGTKLRATRYVRDYNGFSSIDVSMMSEHLLYDGISRLVVQHIPEVLMSMLVNSPDEQLLFLSYNKSGEIAAWSELETFAEIVDVAGYFAYTDVTNPNPIDQQNGNQDVLYLAVRRNGAYYIEKMPYPSRRYLPSGLFNLTQQNIVYMDAWVSGTVAGNFIDGLEHLEGVTVGVLIDDAWQIGEYIVTGGAIQLEQDFTGSIYAVGIVYVGQVKTFEHILGNPKGVGFGTARRWNKLFVRVLDSALPIVRTENADGKNPIDQLPEDRTPQTPMDIAEILRPGIQNLQIANVGYNDGALVIRQDRPYPTHVLGFYGEFGSHNV